MVRLSDNVSHCILMGRFDNVSLSVLMVRLSDNVSHSAC